MAAIRPGDAASALRKLDPGIVVFLLYGPDTGLINERAHSIVQSVLTDVDDPFQLIRLDGDIIAADPARLLDEAGTIGLFGGKRAIWVRASSRNLAPAVEAILGSPIENAVIVIEGGDLARSAPLRSLCERSNKAWALPCYGDSGKDLGEIVDDTLKQAGLTIARDARATLLASLGGDRLATRSELIKLVLYAHGQGEVTADDVDAILSDVSSLVMDAVVDASFAGDLAKLETGARRLVAEGVNASAILGAALRHALQLLPSRLEVEAGRPAGAVVEAWRSLHFRRKPTVEKHLQKWTSITLRQIVGRLQLALLETRRLNDLDDVIASKVLLDIARLARR